MKISKDKWIWMPHAAHFICGNDCKFVMATKIGKYIISTVGEYFPDSAVRKIFASSRGIEIPGKGDEYNRNYLKLIGFEDLSYGGYKYETMVFKAKKNKKIKEKICCPYVIENGSNLDQENYKDVDKAYKGHYKMCQKWSNLKLQITKKTKNE